MATIRSRARGFLRKAVSSTAAVALAVGLCPALAVANDGSSGLAAGVSTIGEQADGVSTIHAGESGSCTWTIVDGALTVQPTSGDEGTLGDFETTYTDEDDGYTYTYIEAPWWEYNYEITSVKFSGTVKAQTCQSMFSGCYNLKSIDLSGLDTSQVKSMSYLFESCSSLASIDLSGIDTSWVRSAYGMFSNCTALVSLDLSGFDTFNLDGISSMFSGCSALKTIYASALWDAEDLYGWNVFYGCTSLKGGNGTAYDSSVYAMFGDGWYNGEDSEYARIDKTGAKGYLTGKSIPLAGATVTTDAPAYEYEGKAVEPAVSVKLFTHVLTEGTDYTVSYSDNEKAGLATVTVTGKGDYEGSASTTFGIVQVKDANTIALKGKDVAVTYSEDAQNVADALSISKAQGTVIYVKTDGDAGISVDSLTGAVSIAAGEGAGSYPVSVAAYALGDDSYEVGKATASFVVTVEKAANPMKVKAKKVKVAASKTASKAAKVKAGKAFKFKADAVGKVTYKKVKKGSSKKLTISKKSGKIKVKAGTKAGTYKIKVKVKAKGNSNYQSKTKKVTVKVKVK